LEEAMGAVMTKLDGQIGTLGDRLEGMQSAMVQQAQAADRTAAEASAAQGRMQERLAATMGDVGAQLNLCYQRREFRRISAD